MTVDSRQIRAHDPHRWRGLIVAMTCTTVVGVTMGLTWPLLALILDHQGVSTSLIGMSSASQSLAVLAVAPLAPRLIAHFGMIRIVALCIAITIVCLALLPLHVDVYLWFPIRIVLGASVSLLFITGETWINHIAGEAARGRIIGIFGFIWSAGFAIGPMIISLTGINGWTPFVTGIGLVALAALSLPFARDAAPKIHWRSGIALRQLFALAPGAMLAAPALGAIDAINDSLLPLYGLRNGLDQGRALLVLTVMFLGTTIGHIPMGWLADRSDRRLLLVATTLATLLMTALLPMTIDHAWLIWPVAALWGAALGGIWTVAIVLIGAKFAGAELAAANSLYSTLYSLGSVAGPAVTGAMMDYWHPAAVPLSMAFILLMYLPLSLIRQGIRPQ